MNDLEFSETLSDSRREREIESEPPVRSSAWLACCPFCGKSDKDTHDYQPAVSLTQYPANRAFVVQCVWCGASGPVFGTAEEAIAEWNKAPRQQANDKLTDGAGTNV